MLLWLRKSVICVVDLIVIFFDDIANSKIKVSVKKSKSYYFTIKKLRKLQKNYKNYKKYRLFRDGWHPTHYFYRHLVKQIIKIIDSEVDSSIIDKIHIDYGYGHKFRYRHILPCVRQCLDLSNPVDEESFYFLDKLITNRELYNFIKSVPCHTKEYAKFYSIFLEITSSKR